jgi:HTH-type transcriptional regulator / antitoxin HigA
MVTKSKNGRGSPLAVANAAKVVPEAYLKLLSRFRLKPISSHQELDQAIALARELDSRAELSSEEEEYVEVLTGLIEAYEDEQYPIPDVSAADMLRFLIDRRGLTQQTIARETDIANSTITALLTGSREMTRRHIESFAHYFGVSASVFLPGDGGAKPSVRRRPRTVPRVIQPQVRPSRAPSKKRAGSSRVKTHPVITITEDVSDSLAVGS